MKALGYVLITLSFLVGSYYAVRPPHALPVEGADANRVPWGRVSALFVVGAVGVVLARVGAGRRSREHGTLTANVETLESSIARIVHNAERIDREKTDLHPFDVHSRIDELFPADLNAFVNARESIAHVYGLQAYAEVMNEFAAGERYLNRVWSASVDCYIDDVHEYLDRSKTQFTLARDALARLREGAGTRSSG